MKVISSASWKSLHQGPGQMDIKGGENPNLLHFDDGCNNVKEWRSRTKVTALLHPILRIKCKG